MDPSQVVEKVRNVKADAVVATGAHAGQPWLEVRREQVHDVLAFLQSDPECAFDCLMDLTAVDHLNQGAPERYAVVYTLYSFPFNRYLRVKSWVPEDEPSIDSASDLWKAAPWAEREVFDLYGIEFRNHPDLKRLMLPEYYTGHPLRKDYPLRGMGERDHFPTYDRETGA